MERLVIYKDGNTTVEIDRNFHEFMMDYVPEDFTLSTNELDLILSISIEILKQNGIEPHDLKLASNVPVAKPPDCFIDLKPPYDVFNEAFDMLYIWNTLDKNEVEVVEKFNEEFGSRGIFTFVFPRKIFDVKGFFYKELEDSCLLMFFGFNPCARY